ncbi:MAG: alpha/beta hydrolase, partial [Reyranellaceae bacterium]
DPLVIKAPRVDLVWGLVNAMDAALAAAPELDGPLLLAYGARDRVVPPEVMREMVAGLRRERDIRVAVYEEGYHLLLRDLQAPVVHRDVLAWMLDPSAQLLSGADAGARGFFARLDD